MGKCRNLNLFNLCILDAVIGITQETLGVNQIVMWLVVACALVVFVQSFLTKH